MRAKEISDLVNQFASETLADIESMEARIQDSINAAGAIFAGQVSALEAKNEQLRAALSRICEIRDHQRSGNLYPDTAEGWETAIDWAHGVAASALSQTDDKPLDTNPCA